LNTARSGAVAVLLPTGKVLIAGGSSNGLANGALNTAELFDPGERPAGEGINFRAVQNIVVRVCATGNQYQPVGEERRGESGAPVVANVSAVPGGTLPESVRVTVAVDDSPTTIEAGFKATPVLEVRGFTVSLIAGEVLVPNVLGEGNWLRAMNQKLAWLWGAKASRLPMNRDHSSVCGRHPDREVSHAVDCQNRPRRWRAARPEKAPHPLPAIHDNLLRCAMRDR
jgi:hypothetical protein